MRALLIKKVPIPTIISAAIKIIPNKIPPAIKPFCPDFACADKTAAKAPQSVVPPTAVESMEEDTLRRAKLTQMSECITPLADSPRAIKSSYRFPAFYDIMYRTICAVPSLYCL